MKVTQIKLLINNFYFKKKKINNSNKMDLQLNSVSSGGVIRRTGNYKPSIWGDRFALSSVDPKVVESYDKQIKVLKEIVKKMLMASTSDPLENVCFIDVLYCLGLSYHFETEITQQLAKAFEDYRNLIEAAGFDLYVVATLFRLFRQHGHPMPCDVFEKFKDKDGKFNEELSGDAKGMLSLYQASQLAMHNEQIMDEALSFTKAHLESLATQSSPHLASLITESLHRPLHKCIPRLAARHFILFYEKEESKNETLLKFAKIDFNRLQLLYQEELCQLTWWYRNLELTSKFVYMKDRIVEIYFIWGYGTYFEPQFSKARNLLSKCVLMASIMDDTYDAYGTIEELRIFTVAMQRMDLSAADELPEYMRHFYEILLNMFDEWDQDLTKEGLSYNTSYTRVEFKDAASAYHVEAEWCNKGYVPPVDEYMSNALKTSGYTAVSICSFLGLGELAGVSACEWVKTQPNILVGCQQVCRLVNDISSHEAEQKRGHVASFIECYMKEYEVSEKEAVEACEKRIDDAWKTINEDFIMQQTSTPMIILMIIVNLARTTEVAYRYDDGHTSPEESLRFHIESLLTQPIPM